MGEENNQHSKRRKIVDLNDDIKGIVEVRVEDHSECDAMKSTSESIPVMKISNLQQAKKWIARHENISTRKTYDAAFKQFVTWCREHGLDPYDATNETTVALYLQQLVTPSESSGRTQPVAKSTLELAASAIADHHRYASCKPTDTALVAQTLKIARTMTKKKNPKKPLTVKMLTEMAQCYAKKTKPLFNDTRDMFMIVLMMAAFLRESEAVNLKKDDVWIEKMMVDGKERKVMMVYVEKAKNDQERNGNVVMVGGSLKNSPVCPLSWYRKYVVVRELNNAWFFHTVKGKKLAKTTPAGVMKKWVRAIGMNEEHFSSHSARIGGTTAASQTGVATLLLKRHGNWKSDVVFDYIRESVEDRLSVTAFLDIDSTVQ